MLMDETDHRFAVRPSTLPSAGMGVFAQTDLPAGTILPVMGVLVRRDSSSDVCTHYANQHKFCVGSQLLLIPLGFGGMVNHSSTPNMEKIIDGENVILKSIRPIAAGEEIFLRYAQAPDS